MQFERVTFENEAGHELRARLDMPVMGQPVAYAIFAHCFTCTKNLRAVGHITTALAEKGVATLRFDFTGLGESEGDFAETDFGTDVSDLVAAARHLGETKEAPQILIGHSLGGTAVLAATPSIESARAVATIGAPSSPTHILGVLDESVEEIRRQGRATVRLEGRPFTITEAFLDSLDSHALPDSLDKLRTPLLITHSPLDNHVGIDNASELFAAAKHPKSFLSLDNADHLLSREEDALYVGEVIAAWSTRFLDTDTREMLQPDLSLEAPTIGTAVRTEAGFRTEVMANGFPLVADEPESVGGTNQGPTPYDLLTASLGTCTSMTLRMYSDRKGWPLESVNVYLEHEKVHASDCEGCEYEEGKIDHIRRDITLEGDLDEDQRQRLLEIADRCPVHRTLHGQIHVETRLTDH